MTRRALLRASDADREQVAERLRRAATEGRLHDDELEERLGAAFSARTYGELDTLVADLPPTTVDRPRAQAPTRPRSVAAVTILLTVAVVLVAAIGSAFTRHAHPSGLGPVIWLIWVAIAVRFFLHRRGGLR
jgi:hypothetical protein